MLRKIPGVFITVQTELSTIMTVDTKAEKEKPLGIEFILAGLSGIGVGLLTNPVDMLKTRLQLQGELAPPGTYKKIYTSTFQAASVIARREGLFTLQAGLVPVLGLQVIINTVRLGSYNFGKRHGLIVDENGDTDVVKTALLSGVAGTVGVVVGSPLYLAKVKLQANRKDAPDAKFLNTRMVLKSLWDEGGFKALYRGWNANIPRLFVGSAVQFSVFGLISDSLKSVEFLSEKPILSTFLASLVSGAALVVSTHPLDVMSTRIYNQGVNERGKGALYAGMFDAIIKIMKKEGLTGLYKGVFPNWLRLTPYVVITQVLYHKMALLFDEFY